MNLTDAQVALLTVAIKATFIHYQDAVRAGGDGRTLSRLCKKGLLEKISDPSGLNSWRITDAGREVIAGVKGGGDVQR